MPLFRNCLKIVVRVFFTYRASFLFFSIGDTTPPSMKGVCQEDIYAKADKFQLYSTVTWTENKAWDNTDGYVE